MYNTLLKFWDLVEIIHLLPNLRFAVRIIKFQQMLKVETAKEKTIILKVFYWCSFLSYMEIRFFFLNQIYNLSVVCEFLIILKATIYHLPSLIYY